MENLLDQEQRWPSAKKDVGLFFDGYDPNVRSCDSHAHSAHVDQGLVGLAPLIWLICPSVTAVIILSLRRGWGSVGLALQLQQRVGYIGVSLLLLVGAELLGINAILVPDTFGARETFTLILAGSVAMMFIKNLLEEFCWRGFLTPHLSHINLHPLAVHIITGLIWGLWILPYWFLFIGEAELKNLSGLGAAQFTLLGIVALTLQAIFTVKFGCFPSLCGLPTLCIPFKSIFAELPLLGYSHVETSLGAISSPNTFSLVYSVAFAGDGLVVMRHRLRNL